MPAKPISKMSYAEYKQFYAEQQAERQREEARKPCMIQEVDTGILMYYDKDEVKFLRPTEVGKLPTVFETAKKAKTARYKVVMASGIPNSHVLWEVVEAKS